MSISPLYKCPHCKTKAFVVCGSNEKMKIGACLACNKSGRLPNKARTGRKASVRRKSSKSVKALRQ